MSHFLLGSFVGLAVGLGTSRIWWWLSQRSRESQENLRRSYEEYLADERDKRTQAILDERQRVVDEMDSRVRESFESLALRALKCANDQLIQTADGALIRREEAIGALVAPVKDGLVRLSEVASALEVKREACYAVLDDKLARLHCQTEELSRALRKPTLRGTWGELTLTNVATSAGLQEGIDFHCQVSMPTDASPIRPDMILNLPRRRQLVIDAKTPLDAYRRAVNATDPEVAAAEFKLHAKAVRDHAKCLASKAYWSQFEASPAFVVMFLPTEAAFLSAIEHDTDLLDLAARHRVIIANPATLLAVMRTVSWVLDEERLAENAEEIKRIATEFSDRLSTLAAYLSKLGKQLRLSNDAYNSTVGCFNGRILPKARQLRECGVGADSISAPPDLECSLREPLGTRID